MAINFPGSPSLNDTYTYSGKTWKWNSAAWQKTDPTETGNTEGNTGEVAYYSGKGSTIAGATAFFYDGDKVGIGTSGPTETLDVRGGITASGGLYVAGGATFSNIILKGNSADNFITFADGSTQGTRHDLKFRLNGVALNPTDLPHRTLNLTSNASQIIINSIGVGADTAQYSFQTGSDIPKLATPNIFTNVFGNVFESPIGSNKYTGNSQTETVAAYTDSSSATYMGVTSGTINFKILGTHILDMDTDIHAFVGVSADMGATFGGDVTATTFVGALTGNVTGNASGTSATVTAAAQTNITSVGTLTALTMGGELSCADNLVTRPKLKDYAETALATSSKSASFNVDFESGNVQSFTFADDLTVSFTNPPASGSAGTVTLIVTNGGANTTTWNAAVKWPGDNAPSLTSSGVDILSFTTIDAGTTIYGFVGGINFS